MRKIIVSATLVIVLAILNFTIYEKESHIKDGKVVFLKLAPVDPRSLMQGDYMALRFDISRNISKDSKKDGFVLVKLDEQKIASFVSLYKDKKLKENEMLLQYRIRANKVKFASNAFFFEEGTAKRYETAKFGEFRVNNKHELLLVAMYDVNMNLIK